MAFFPLSTHTISPKWIQRGIFFARCVNAIATVVGRYLLHARAPLLGTIQFVRLVFHLRHPFFGVLESVASFYGMQCGLPIYILLLFVRESITALSFSAWLHFCDKRLPASHHGC